MFDDVYNELNTGIERAIQALRRDLSQIRTGRANAEMLDSIRVDYYGVPTPLAQVATVSVPEPRLITVKPWQKNQVKAIDKALRESDLGINPQFDGDLIRIPIPALTAERGKEMIKLIQKLGENCRVAVRRRGQEANESIKELGGDDADTARKKVEDMVAGSMRQIDAVVAAKEKEII